MFDFYIISVFTAAYALLINSMQIEKLNYNYRSRTGTKVHSIRHIHNCYKADPSYDKRCAKALRLTVKEINVLTGRNLIKFLIF